jgi:hypothetical protein
MYVGCADTHVVFRGIAARNRMLKDLSNVIHRLGAVSLDVGLIN